MYSMQRADSDINPNVASTTDQSKSSVPPFVPRRGYARRALGAVDNNNVMDITQAPYLNAGVMLFDWPATLENGLLGRARQFARERSHLCEWHDQDALNAVGAGCWISLDQRWNFTSFRARKLPQYRPCIMHYTGVRKPWGTKRYPRHLADAIWRLTLRNSPWPDFAAPVPLRAFFQAARWQCGPGTLNRAQWRRTADGLRIEYKS